MLKTIFWLAHYQSPVPRTMTGREQELNKHLWNFLGCSSSLWSMLSLSLWPSLYSTLQNSPSWKTSPSNRELMDSLTMASTHNSCLQDPSSGYWTPPRGPTLLFLTSNTLPDPSRPLQGLLSDPCPHPITKTFRTTAHWHTRAIFSSFLS
jgi:hypothetical protein